MCHTPRSEVFTPIKITRPCSTIVLTATNPPFNLPASKVLHYDDRANEWCAHDTLMLKRQ